LDEFFKTGVYRPRTSVETSVTSSPSMDISKASNFERFVFDLVGRDPAIVAELWARVDRGQAFDLSATVHWQKMPNFGIVSGKSTHSDRIKTIRFAQGRYNVMLDTHTADGLKVALENRLPGIPMIVLETAQPAKFEETIREALGTEPVRPADLKGIENLPQRVVVMAPDVDAVKQFVADHV
ncbi:MAG: threonine synthase, partial [Azonexus sp.]